MCCSDKSHISPDNITEVMFYNGNLIASSFGRGIYNFSTNSTIELLDDGNITDLQIVEDQLWASNFDGNFTLFQSSDGIEWMGYEDQLITSIFPLSIQNSQGNTLWIERDIQEGGGFEVLNIDENQSRIVDFRDGLPVNDIN